MSGLAFALVLTAALLHAAWNFLLKRINAGPELVWLFSVLILIIYLPVAVAVWVIEKPQFDLVSGGFVLGSSLLHLGYLLVLQQGYRRGDLSLVYPTARATGPFLSTIFAVIILVTLGYCLYRSKHNFSARVESVAFDQAIQIGGHHAGRELSPDARSSLRGKVVPGYNTNDQ